VSINQLLKIEISRGGFVYVTIQLLIGHAEDEKSYIATSDCCFEVRFELSTHNHVRQVHKRGSRAVFM